MIIFTPWIMSVDDSNYWVTYLAIYNFAILADLTFTPTFARFYAYCSAQSSRFNDIDLEDLNYIQKEFFMILSFSGTVLVLISLIYVVGNITIDSLILCISVFITLYTGRYVSAVEGCGGILYVRQIILFQVLVQCIGLVLSVTFSFDLFFIIFLYYTPALISLFLLRLASKRYVSKKKEFNKRIIKKYRKVLMSQSLKGATSLLSTIGTIQALTLITSTFYSSLSSNIIYSMMLIRQISNFCQVPFYIKIPVMAKLYSSGEEERLLKQAIQLSLVTITLILSLGMLIPFISTIIDVWFNIKLPTILGLFWALLVFAFILERALALTSHYFALRNIILWHESGVLFMLVVLSSFFFLDFIGLSEKSLPVSLIIGSLCSLFYLYIKGNHILKIEVDGHRD
ncbi:hypothetical protein [Vibrio vulnificus]|uniref:hypothetical protein n=1 Tax=Vibrio vulnificus TaxID=672 RepID=UPI0038CDC260